MISCPCEGCFLYRLQNVYDCTAARQLEANCIKSMLRLTRPEKKTFLLEKLRAFQVKVTDKNYFKFVFLVGESNEMRLVCREGFTRAYNVSHWYVEDLIKRLKQGDVNCLKDLNESHAIKGQDKKISDFAEEVNEVYSYVKIREYKSSCGHCNLCTAIYIFTEAICCSNLLCLKKKSECSSC